MRRRSIQPPTFADLEQGLPGGSESQAGADSGIAKTPATTAPLDLLSLAARVKLAAELLHGHKIVTATIARRYGALLLDYDEYTRDERSYDRIQSFLGVRSRVALRHSNMKTPPVDVAHLLRHYGQNGS